MMQERPNASPLGVIYRAIRYRGATTLDEVAADADQPRAQVAAFLDKLEREGLLARDGDGDAARYRALLPACTPSAGPGTAQA